MPPRHRQGTGSRVTTKWHEASVTHCCRQLGTPGGFLAPFFIRGIKSGPKLMPSWRRAALKLWVLLGEGEGDQRVGCSRAKST